MTDTVNHSFAIWDANSEVTLCNVPWDSQYDDTVRFSSRQALDDYIDNIPNEDKRVITDMSYVRAYAPISLEDPFNTVNQYNYVRVRQPGQDVAGGEPSKNFYYFITNVAHIAPNNTQIQLDLDVFQTFIYDVEFLDTFVERSHMPIAERKAFDNFGAGYLTAEESLNLGSVYAVRHDVRDIALSGATGTNDTASLGDAVIVSTIALEKNNEGEWGDSFEPKVPVTPGNMAFGTEHGIEYTIVQAYRWSLVGGVLRDYPWIAQGVMSMKLVPPLARYLPGFEYGQEPTKQFGIPTIAPKRALPHRDVNLQDSWRTHDSLDVFQGRYRHLKKFLTAPYTVVELTCDMGAALTLRPELMQARNLWVEEHPTINLGEEAITYRPGNYNNYGNEDNFVQVYPLPTIGIVNDAGALAVANQAYQRIYQEDMSNIQDGLTSAQNRNTNALNSAANRATRSMGDANRVATGMGIDNQISSNNQMLDANTGQNFLNNIGGGAIAGAGTGMFGGPAAALGGAVIGAGAGAAKAFMNQGHMDRTTQINNDSLRMSKDISIQQSIEAQEAAIAQSNQNASANVAYANEARSLNRQAEAAAIEAQTKTAQLTPPSMSSQAGGALEKYGRTGLGVRARIKTISDERVRAIGEYWLRYGYATNAYMSIPNDLQCMSHFTYWKFASTYVGTAPMPETFKHTIRGIFMAGTTVHRHPDTIGRIDPADNEPIVKDYY